MTVGVLMLAAGRSRRFGSDKRLAPFRPDRSLLETSIETVIGAGLPLLVALRPDDQPLAGQLRDRGVTTVRCANASAGMGHTIADGIAALPADWVGVLVALGDMPLVRPTTYLLLARGLTREGIVAPEHGGRRGHPVGFGASFFPALQGLGGDRGGAELLTTHRQRVAHITVDDPGILLDVDDPAERDRLLAREQ